MKMHILIFLFIYPCRQVDERNEIKLGIPYEMVS
jgi:hypothetical protein